VNACLLRWQVTGLNEPCPPNTGPPVPPEAVLARAKEIELVPPASASNPVTVVWPLGPRAAFSGVSGCRNPGVTVSTAVASVVAFSLAVTTTSALSPVR
jgi:hypothetical protein